MTGTKAVELALQGGGAHGAFTWGVLDRMLADPRLEIAAISGTSAGAMNAAVLAHGMEKGGTNGARQALEHFWRAVSDAARFSPVQRTPLDILMGRWSLDFSPGYLMLDMMTRVVSPYQTNPANLNPLRDIVADLVDFDAVNCCGRVKVFITATDVESGRAHVFRQPHITADSLMASACLPFMFQAVEIDGRFYWDGGYMGNPALFPLVDECPTRDLILIQVNPFWRAGPPTGAQDILNRLNEITFNASLVNELRSIRLLKQLIEAQGLESERYRDMMIHRIHASAELEHLRISSKMNAEWEFLTHLKEVGWRTADEWLERNFDRLGVDSTFDLDALFGEGLRPPPPRPAKPESPAK